MIERLALVLGLLLLALSVGYMVRARVRRRSEAFIGSVLPARLGARIQSSGPGIVYFYGPHCASCRSQADVLGGLAGIDSIPIVRIDASVETQLAGDLGVMTVPATVVFDRSRQIRAVNLSFCSAAELRTQLLAASAE